MAEIKRIQLRGISRAPSDRLTEDGGVAESLNIQIDNTEAAPIVQPKDVSEKWGFPNNIKVDYAYIHKTANFERLIIVADHQIGYIRDGEVVNFLALELSESVSDITSLGNTLVISTTSKMLYVLWKDGEYISLGSQVPFPQIELTCKYESLDEPTYVYTNGGGVSLLEIPTEAYWNEDSVNGSNHKDTNIREMLNIVDAAIQEAQSSLSASKTFLNRVFVRYSVTLYDGTRLSSMPILLGSIDPFDVFIEFYMGDKTVNGQRILTQQSYSVKVNSAFKIKAKAADMSQMSPWLDLIKSIDFFVSVGTDSPLNRSSSIMYDRTEDRQGTQGIDLRVTTTARLKYHSNSSDKADSLLQDSALTYLVKSINVHEAEGSSVLTKDFTDLVEGVLVEKSYEADELVQQTLLSGDDMKHYFSSASRHITYNNSLLLLQPESTLAYTYDWLNNQQNMKPDFSKKFFISTDYSMIYLLKSQSGEDLVARKSFYRGDIDSRVSRRKTYSFQTFPDSRCYKLIVKATRTTRNGNFVSMVQTKYAELEMLPHPYLDCAYHYAGYNKTLWDLCTLDEMPEVPQGLSSVDDRQNYLFISEMNNPFFFPTERKYAFSSAVIGAAVATFALSQGQFGQFPLYVFTEDGIYAMQVADDGSIMTSKPLSRDVCINPDSIVSIDQAVVFLAQDGVKLLRGSDVVNISPYMLRQAQPVGANQTTIIGATEFSDLLPAITEAEQFMSFMKKAKPEYDYAGKRIIFFSSEEKGYQYIYSFNTQTWHKSTYESKDIPIPLNSYPELLVLTQGTKMQYSISYANAPLTGWREDPDTINLDYDIAVAFNRQFNYAAYGYLRMTQQQALDFIEGRYSIPTTHLGWSNKQQEIVNFFKSTFGLDCTINRFYPMTIQDYSTTYDGTEDLQTLKSVMITRPLDLGYPDVRKKISDLRVRGQFPKGAVKFILEGSDDGYTFYTLSSLRGKSWKLFRLTLLCDLGPDDRVSWVDVQFETRFTNKLR